MWKGFSFVFALLVLAAFGQVETARITGTVTDSSAAVVPNAEIVITHLATNTAHNTITDHPRHYLSVPLRVGEYRVEATAAGFKRLLRSGIVLQIQDTATVDFRLEVGASTESISVMASAPLLTTTEATQ